VHAEEVLHERADFRLPAESDHLLVMHLDRPADARETLTRRTGRLRAGSLVFLPARHETSWHLDQVKPAHHLHLRLSAAAVEALADQAKVPYSEPVVQPLFGDNDVALEGLAMSLLAELRSPALGGPLVAESLGMLVALRLLRRNSHADAFEPATARRLSAQALRAVQAVVEDALGEELSLARMAAAAHLSPYHFARLFRATTGASPYQYVVRRGLNEARLLIAATDWSIAELPRRRASPVAATSHRTFAGSSV
jgi:AraC family transcriptional regulator